MILNKMHKPKRLKQRGDTIIEVIIVLAILGSALGIGYSIANKSLLATRQAQESSQASSLMQSQVELMQAYRKVTDSANAGYIYRAGAFCMNPVSGASPPVSTSGCEFNNDGSNFEVGGRYKVQINQVVPSGLPTSNTFKIIVTWDDVSGEAADKNTATFYYRLYPTS